MPAQESEGAPDGGKSGGQKRGVLTFYQGHQAQVNPKFHVLADIKGRPIHMFLLAGQTSDYSGAQAFLPKIFE